MYIDKIMTRKVVSVSENTRINEMLELMHKHQLQHLPVISESGELLGIIAHQDIQKAAPSAITTLSVGESNYLLAKITAKQIMQKEVTTCKPSTLIEEAGQILREQSISSLPVVKSNGDNDKQLIGIVTMEDILDFFLDLTGCLQTDATRIAVRVSDEKGGLSTFMNLVNELGGYIATVVSPTEQDQEGKRVCIVRYYAENPHLLDQQLKQAGIEIISENFLAETLVKETSVKETLVKETRDKPYQEMENSKNKQSDSQKIATFICQNDQLAQSMNIQLLDTDKGQCSLSMKIKSSLLNAAGVVHGGATFTLADVAFAIASNSHGRIALSLNANICYPATAKKGDTLIAIAKEISLGKTTATYQVEVKRKSDKKLTALFTGTVFRKQEQLINDY